MPAQLPRRPGPALATAALLVAAGCAKPMMPTPVLLTDASLAPFHMVPEEERSNQVDLFYVSDRPASGAMTNRSYKNGWGETLRVGTLKVRFGAKSMTWEQLCDASTTAERRKSVSMHLENVTELGTLVSTVPTEEGERHPELLDPAGQEAFAAAINDRLADDRFNDIYVYIHGANTNFYKPATLAGELYHFMGRDGVMIAYCWPTRQTPLLYAADIAQSAKSAPALVELLDFLAHNTDAERINVLSYSAGAVMASTALADLRRRHAHLDEGDLHRELRIGTVFFAAGDVDLKSFVREDLETFYDLPASIRVTVSEGDVVLGGLSRTLHAGSRLGAPAEGALDQEDLDQLTEMLPKLDAVWVTYADEGRDGGDFNGHGYWYRNPWVSTDVLVSLRADVPPDQRGLKWIEGTRSWYFPNDYPERVSEMVRAYRRGEFARDERPEESAIQEVLQSDR